MCHPHKPHIFKNILRGYSLVGLSVFVVTASYFLWPIHINTPVQSSTSTQILDRNGVLLREIRPEGRGIWIGQEEVQPFASKALIATEDRNFYTHFGIDLKGIARALRDNAKARQVVSGASTLTMQLARMHLGHSSRSLTHKIHETLLAVRLEIHNTKADILNAWLNSAYFGNQTYGIEAASRLYFGKPALDLTHAEAAFLVGLPQNPIGYNPYRFPGQALSRFKRVLGSMVDTGKLSVNQMDSHLNVPIDIRPPETVFRAPHFVEAIKAQYADTLLHHPTLKTSLDASLQAEVEALTRGHLDRLGSEYVTNAAAIIIDNQTGEILAYMGSANFWDKKTEGQNDGVQMLRQPGSALKPFTYALALESGAYTPATVLPDIEVQIPEAGGAFAPKNYDKTYHGPIPLREALANSYNVPSVRIARDLGVPQLLAKLRLAGFHSLDRSPDHYGVGLTLGNGEVRLFELARAYAAFARQGYPLPLSFLRKHSSHSHPGTPIFSQDIAYLISDILSDPEAREAAFGRYGPLELPFPVAVKTGTSKDYRDNWAVGYTPRHTVAVWVGNFDGSPMQKVSGVSGAGPLFKSIMLHLGESGSFVPTDQIETLVICPLSGHKPSSICPLRKTEHFLSGTTPRDTCTVHQKILIDTRSNLLATQQTPKTDITPTLFTVLPDIYHPWMRKHGLTLPPTQYASAPIEVELDRKFQDTTQLRIAYPVSGMIFQIDPVLRQEYQKITLEGIVPQGINETSWWINETRLASNTLSTEWPLQKGVHTIELREKGGKRGASVQIQVVE